MNPPGFVRWRPGTRVIAAALLVLGCVPAEAGPTHRFDVTVHDSLERIDVRGCFAGNAPNELVAQTDGARFYLNSMRIGGRQLVPAGDKVSLGKVEDGACLEYRVTLQPAQSRAQTGGPETRRVAGNMLTSIGEWLWRPSGNDAGLELRFHLPPGIEVSAPWPRLTASDAQPVYRVGPSPSNWPGVVVFGNFARREIRIAGTVLQVALLDIPAPSQQAQLETWIAKTAAHVATLYGRFPVPALQVVVAPTPGKGGPVPWAYVSRGGGPAVHLFVNAARPAREFDRDWTLAHEMSHLFLPYIVSRDAWLFEGLPTYLQNVLMARGGATSAEEAWLRMRTGFRRGARTAPNLSLAQANERYGIGGTYLRVYWAGAALMLAADLRLRSETGGQHSLDTALEQLSRCCASEQRRWSAQEIIARLDAVTGTTVFSDVTRDQFDAAGFPDYDALLARAGVKIEGVRVQFDATAPWARAREALMQPSGLAPQADGINPE